MLDRWAYATTFALACSIGVVFVFLADFQDRYGLADWQLGVVAAAGFVAALITQLGLSPLVDRGIVRPLVYLAILFGGLGTMSFAFAEQFWSLALSRAAAGVGLGLFGVTARKAILGLDLVGGGKKVGTLLSVGVGGFIIGPGLGAVFGAIAFEAPFLVIGAIIFLVGFPAARLISEAPIDTAQVMWSDLGRLLRTPRVQGALTVQCIVFAFIGVFDSILDRYLTDLGAGTSAVALTLIVMGSPMLILPRLAGDFAERLGGAKVVLPGIALIIPALAAYGWAGGAFTVGLIGLFHGSGESFATVSAQVMVLEETGTERIAVGNAIMEAMGMAVATATAFTAPIIYGAQGPKALFGGAAVVGLVLAGLLVISLVRIRREDQADPTRAVSLAAHSAQS